MYQLVRPIVQQYQVSLSLSLSLSPRIEPPVDPFVTYGDRTIV
jgi:hypothetical protein